MSLLLIGMVLLLAGCVPGDGSIDPAKPAGFLWGVWHGWVAPISLIVGLFDKSIRVYEVQNTGWWYDFRLLYRNHQRLRRFVAEQEKSMRARKKVE